MILSKFNNLISKFVRHDLIKGSFCIFIGGTIGSFLSFIFNLFLARTLNYSNYGVYTSLLSLITLVTLPASALTVVLVRFATKYFSKNEKIRSAILYKRMLLIFSVIAFGIFFGILAISHLIQMYLHINDIRLILIISFSIGFSYFGVVNKAFLQSLMKFPYYAFSHLSGNILKIIIGIILVLLGLNVKGALIGVLVSPLTVFILGFIPLVFLLKTKTKNKTIRVDMGEIITYAMPVSICLVSLSSFIASDVILVKHFFNPVWAGYYGGLSVMGKVIFYFTGVISSVMFPLVVKRYTRGENYRNVYYLSLILVSLPSVLITFFYFFIPEYCIVFFLGGREYLNLIPYLGLFGVFMTLFSILYITVNFLLSLKKTEVSFLLPVSAFIQIVFIYLFHANFNQVILSSIFSVSIALIMLLVVYLFKYEKKRK